MADIFTGNLSMSDDWGNVVNEQYPKGAQASGQSVQNFIKSYLQEVEDKPSAFHSLDDTVNNRNILLAFRSEENKTSWLAEWTAEGKDVFSDTALNDSRVITHVMLQKSIPEPYYQITLENHTETGNTYVSTDGRVVLSFKFISKYFKPNETGNMVSEVITEDGDIYFERRRDSSEAWAPLTKNVPISTIQSMSPETAPLTVDLSSALNDGYQEVRVMVVGKTSNQSTPWMQFNITKTQLQLELATDWAIAQSNGYIKLEYYITGAVDKNLNIRILDDDGDRIITEHVGTGAFPKNQSKSYTVADIRDQQSDAVKIITHGVRTIEAWVSMVGNDRIVSDKVVSQIMVVTDPTDETPYVILNGLTLKTEEGVSSLTKSLTNWTNQSIFKYALYHPTKDKIPFTMELKDYNAAAGDNFLYADYPEMLVGTQLEYHNTIEVESNDALVYAELTLSSNGVYLTDPISMTIDNTGGYSPTAGADFIINPRTRSNDDAIKNSIINTVNKSTIPSTWVGFDFNRDGWTTDNNGNRCLRVLSGQELTIDYTPFVGWGDKDNQNNSCTIEFCFATRNISDETTPIIRMCRYRDDAKYYDGWEQRALEGVYMTPNKYDKIKQDVWFTEGVMTHVAINIVHSLINNQNFCRIFVNGRINREFVYEESTLGDVGENATAANARKIIFGNALRGCDLDIYGFRVYKKKLTSEDILQDYISNLPTVSEKQAEKLANNILNEDGVIDYNLASKYYNTLLWKFNDQNTTTRMVGLAESVYKDEGGNLAGADTKKTKMKGDLVIRVFELDANGNQKVDANTGLPILDKKRSGTINHMTAKGQGTSSMYYWKWNQRWEFQEYDQSDFEKGYRNSMFTPLEISENYDLVEDYSWETNKDGELELVNNSKWNSKEKDDKNVPISVLNDKDVRTASWQPQEGEPFAKRLDGKINFASPMQSHKLASVCMYNDLWKDVVKDNEITAIGGTENGKKFTGTADGYKSCRVAVIQRPFLVFCQKSENDPIEFYGLYTMGPSKGDKPTFGYNKKDFPNFVMMEGCDNGAKLVRCLVPWNDIDIRPKETDDDGDTVFEIFYIGSDEQWEISMGSTKVSQVCSVTEKEDEAGNKYNEYGPVGSGKNPVFASFKEMNNFCYQLNPKLRCWDKGDGSYADLAKAQNDLLTDNAGNKIKPDTNYVYWTIKGTAIPSDKVLLEGVHYIYNTYRFDENKNKWVHCGVEYNSSGDDYLPLNISVQTGYVPTTGTRESQNQTFITKRTQLFKSGIGKYVDERDMRYSLQFLKLIAASDNWAKNTYLYNAGLTDVNGNLTSKWRFFQDDLDTILSLDNSGYKVKPYYIEEHDTYVNEQGETVGYWNASDNAMYCLAELAWENEMRAMMREILTAMAARGGSVEGCFDKYYGSVTRYIPAVAYNEITRLLYEDAEVNRANGLYTYGNTVDPLAQAVGDQLQAETQWQKQRSVYLSSYATYGVFASGSETSTGSLAFRAGGETGSSTEMRFKFIPSMWLYPSMANGSSTVNGVAGSTDPNEVPNYNFNVQSIANPPRIQPGQPILFKTSATADQTVTIRGIDYYTDLGDFGQVSASSKYGFPLSGRKLEQFKITSDNGKITLLPSSLSTPASGMDNIKRIEIRGEVANNVSIIGGQLDISGLWRLNYVDLTATSITSIKLPEKSNIKDLLLPSTLTNLTLEKQPKLTNMSLTGVQGITNLKLSSCPLLNTYNIFNRLYERKNGARLQECYIDDIDWNNVKIDQLNYLADIYDVTLKGVMRLDSKEKLDFNTKSLLISKFGNIDDDKNILHITYTSEPFDTSSGRITGESYITEDGEYQYLISVSSGNDFRSIRWSLDNTTYATINAQTGKLTYTNVESDIDRHAIISCAIEILDPTAPAGSNTYYTYTMTKDIYFYEKVAEIGDYVYSDGTISTQEDHNIQKTVIGICVYVNPKKPSDRLMVALNNLKNLKSYDANTNTYTWNDSYQWGICTNAMGNSGLITDYYDVANISNTTSGNTTIKMSDIYEADKFVEYNSSVGLGQIGELGVTSTLTTEIPMYEAGDFIPFGQKNTLEIIEHRNKNILKNSNISFTGKRIPGYSNASGSYIDDEMSDLNRILDSYTDSNVNNKLYFYPAASYCYCYKPINNENGEPIEVVDKFKQHNWYLPTLGELARVWYCERAGLMDTAKLKNIYSELGYNVNYWTSTEYSKDNAVYMYDSGSGSNKYIYTTNESKHNAKRIRPVAKF